MPCGSRRSKPAKLHSCDAIGGSCVCAAAMLQSQTKPLSETASHFAKPCAGLRLLSTGVAAKWAKSERALLRSRATMDDDLAVTWSPHSVVIYDADGALFGICRTSTTSASASATPFVA